MATSTPVPLRLLAAGLRTFLVLTVALGLVYPLAMTGIAQVLFPRQADGSLVQSGGSTVGSELIGQSFTRPATRGGEAVTDASGVQVVEPDPAYFQSRPSEAGTGYDPKASAASNYGPENPLLITLVKQRRAAAAGLDGVGPAQVAPDALLASGSGLDPHISPAYADQQVARVAKARGLGRARVHDLVDQYTQGRTLGFLGEPRVNVLLLNVALDGLKSASQLADSE